METATPVGVSPGAPRFTCMLWWDSCAPGRARVGDRRMRPDRVRGGELVSILDALVLVHGWAQANPKVCLHHTQSHKSYCATEADLTPTLHTLTLKSGFYFLQSLRRGARWGPTQRSPMISVSFGSRYWVRYPSQRSEQRSPPQALTNEL